MDTNLTKNLNTAIKNYPKKFMRSKKISFGYNPNAKFDKKTGEILNEEKTANVCFYIPSGEATPYIPNCCMSIKIGNRSIGIYAEEVDDLERFLIETQKFFYQNAKKMSEVLLEERKKYRDALEAKKIEIDDNYL